MKVIKTSIEDLLIIETILHKDERGWFSETYNEKRLIEQGIQIKFVQDNHSYNIQRGVLRGLHFQKEPYAQAKLVRCTKGKIWDVAVDLRKSSQTYLKWFGIELTAKNQKMLLIPQGFAHGFVTLENDCEVQYKVDNIYDKNSDCSIKYNDPEIKITWPVSKVILSDKDMSAPLFKDLDVNFK